MSATGVSVVVPVLDEVEMVDEVAAAVEAVLGPVGAWELVLVDDGSSDGSWERISELAAGQPAVRGLRLCGNYGQHNALLAGIRAARHPVTVTLDADLQYPPEAILAMAELVDAGWDVVYGTPPRRAGGLAGRAAVALLRRLLAAMLGVQVPFSALRAFRTELRDAFASFDRPFVSIDVLLIRTTRRVTAIPVVHRERRAGRSSYSLSRRVSLGVTMLLGFAAHPVRFLILSGGALATAGLALVVYDVRVADISIIAAGVVMLGAGAGVVALGLAARARVATAGRPSYAIAEKAGAT